MINKEKICPECKSKEVIKRGILRTENKGKKQRFGCKKCGHRLIGHINHVGCMHYDKKDEKLNQGYCPCKVGR